MNPTSGHSAICAAAFVPSPCFDADEFKELYEPTSETSQFLSVQHIFEGAGYAISRAEISPHGLPMAYVRMRRRTAPHFAQQRKFRQHIKEILKNAPSWLNGAEMDAQQDGGTVWVSFVWPGLDAAKPECPLEHEFLPIPP